MAIPSASGTEVIKYNKLTALSSSFVTGITGVTDHIYTILSIIWTETSEANAEELFMTMFDSDGTSNEHYLLVKAPLPIKGTFVWNDKFSFSGNKTLRFKCQNTADVDVFITYIDQNWV